VLRLVQLWQEFQQAGVSVHRLADVLNAPAEPNHRSPATAGSTLEGHVAFESVTFRYRPDRPEALRRMSFVARPGSVIGIVGRSGSGKSTIAKLIQRLYVPESGRVLIDSMDVAQIDPTWLRRQVGVVLQENFLFNRSVRDNIALADPGQPWTQSLALLGSRELTSSSRRFRRLRHRGRRARLLAVGGQRQRIAIARALIVDPRILIFDEATSALDYESERIVQQNLSEMCAGRTVFLIAHRLSTVRSAQRIVVVDQGTIIEEGSHDELIARGGFYAHLHGLQDGRSVASPTG